MIRIRSYVHVALLGAFAAPLAAQVPAVPVQLTNNFNGIVHAGEDGMPDDLVGFRAISDRALDFTAGVPNDPLLNKYPLIEAAAQVFDIVHLGNRNTVDNGNWMFDAMPDGDDVGVQPAWLLNVDQSGPQTSVLLQAMPITSTTEAVFLYQISNGGGSFDVTFTLASGGSFTGTLTGPDWFNGAYPGRAAVDSAVPDNNLSITEGRIALGSLDGDTVTEITFENRSNTVAGYAILACNFEYPLEPSRTNQIALNYNFNGIVHLGETGIPDDLNGFRSISDRGLDFTGGVPANLQLEPYQLVDQPFALDIVHLGNRNNNWPFDPTPDGDNVGVQPAWLTNPDQTTPQVTTLTDNIILDAASTASILAHGSDGGGMIDVEFRFASGAPFVATIQVNDWFGGALPGCGSIDEALPSASLNLTEPVIDLSQQAGRVLTEIAFQNINAGPTANFAIVAMNVTGCVECANAASAAVNNLGGGAGPTMTTTSTGQFACDLDWTVNGVTPNSPGLWVVGIGTSPVPIGIVFPACSGTVFPASPLLLTAFADGNGAATFVLPLPVDQSLCGAQVASQYAEVDLFGPCLTILSDAVEYTIGN